MKESVIILLGAAITLAVLALAPVAMIWAINTLFPIEVAYSIKNIVAAFVLILLVNSGSVRSN